MSLVTAGDESRIVGLGTALAAHRVDQPDARRAARELFDGHYADLDRLLSVFDHAGVDTRHFCVPLEWFGQRHGTAERNAIYLREAMSLSTAAARRALADAGVDASAIDSVIFVSSTGLATPSLDARLALELELRRDVRRDATFGHGCAGGVGGLARAAQQARDRPGTHVLLVATELCSLTFQACDSSKANLVATSLFADGSAAAVVSTRGDGPALINESCVLWPDSTDIMGWNFTDDGMELVMSRDVPGLVRRHFADSVEHTLEPLMASAPDIVHHIFHPGGTKVLAALARAMPCTDHDLRWSSDTLRAHGNMSAPTALFVLRRFLDADERQPGELGLISAMGPGFAAEHVTFRC